LLPALDIVYTAKNLVIYMGGYAVRTLRSISKGKIFVNKILETVILTVNALNKRTNG